MMARLDSFTFRVNEDERKMLDRLSKFLQRSQSDAVRLLIREAVKQLPNDNPDARDDAAAKEQR